MSFSSSSSPPPPLPSPLLVPTPLPSPPPRLILQRHPPSSPNHALSHDIFHRAPRRRPALPPRTLPSRCRSPPPTPAVRSPPPPVPPIPASVHSTNHSFIRPPRRPSTPNRASALDLYLDHQMEDMCCESQIGGALTCMQFVAVHNPTGQCHS